MAAWMLYVGGVAAALGAGGLLVERALSHLRRPTRWTWILVMFASVVWPLAHGLLRPRGRAGAGVSSTTVPSGTEVAWPTLAAETSAAALDLRLLGAWVLTSAFLLALLLVSAGALWREGRRWREGLVAGEGVCLSGAFGPAVVGVLRPRIVLPAWVLELDEPLQRLIVRHEREHVRAGDSRMLLASLVLLTLLPWCAPLWWQFHRLRVAIETDCDRRLLDAGVPAREYAELLLAVARRRQRAVVPLAAMAPSRRSLERRIHRIVAGPPRRSASFAVAFLSGAALVPLATSALPAPPSPAILTAPLRAGPHPAARPDGSLPGDPGEVRIAMEILTHHGTAIAEGLPPETVIWFVVDRDGAVTHTGIEEGTGPEVEGRIRAYHPDETSDYVLSFEGEFAGVGEASVLWMLPGL